jgi:hypothetical protein
MKALRNIGLIVVVLCALTVGSAYAGTTTNEKTPFDMWVWVSCANGGNGELVRLTGELHVLFLVTFDQDGGLLVASHFQPMGVTGLGEVTGDRYQATGITRDNENFRPAGYPFETTYVNNFWIVGQGSGNNFLVHQTFHITVNANGELTTQVDNFRTECK